MHNKNKGNKRSHTQKSVAKTQTSSPTSSAAPLPAGTPAPDFALKSTPDQTVSLSEFQNRPVVLVFYPADFSPVCGEMRWLCLMNYCQNLIALMLNF
jgi:hypothetical protein